MKAMKRILILTMAVSSLASAEGIAQGGAGDFGTQVPPEAEKLDMAGDPCAANNMEIRIEDYDPKTGTYEIVDTKCDGQGPWYSTPEVIGCAVPTLWMKTDTRLFLNKTVTLTKQITFHPERDEARKQGNSINPKTCKKRALGGFLHNLLRGGSAGGGN